VHFTHNGLQPYQVNEEIVINSRTLAMLAGIDIPPGVDAYSP